MAPLSLHLNSSTLTMRVLGFHSFVGFSKGRLAVPVRSFSMAQQTTEQLEEHKIWKLVTDHQRSATKLTHPNEARTLVASRELGFLSTISKKHDGFPVTSLTEFAADASGQPLLAVSTLSPHTKNLESNPKCSLLVSRDPTDKTDTMITLIGEAKFLSDQDRKDARDLYLKKFPNAFWVDFGDFKLATIKLNSVRFVSGLKTGHAEVGELDADEYKDAKADPISQFSVPVTAHMNKDHSDDTKLIVEHVVGVPVENAYMLDLDSLGFYVKVSILGAPTKLRIPFPRPAEDRKDVKTLIVEMLSSAKAATAQG